MAADSRVDRALGIPAVANAATAVTAAHLRVPAYHGVPDPAAFRRQLELIAGRFRPVTGAQVADALHGGPALPAKAVWVTFDDGCADVVDAGLPELERVGVPATMFICPGLVAERRPFWWSQVTAALAEEPYEYEGRRWTDRSLVVRLKGVADEERRRVVDDLAARTPAPRDLAASVLTTDQARRWLEAGHELGNHTWDHPCLDHCGEAEQARQVRAAHEALTDLLGRSPDLFAYPNGDWAAATESVLDELGYRAALLFDHRLTARATHPLRISRLRLDSDASPTRAAAVLSGTHTGLFRARAALASRKPSR